MYKELLNWATLRTSNTVWKGTDLKTLSVYWRADCTR